MASSRSGGARNLGYEIPLKTLDKSTQKKWDSLERIYLNR